MSSPRIYTPPDFHTGDTAHRVRFPDSSGSRYRFWRALPKSSFFLSQLYSVERLAICFSKMRKRWSQECESIIGLKRGGYEAFGDTECCDRVHNGVRR